MNLVSDLKTIVQMLRPEKGKNHAERLENFYRHQAEGYDKFRKKLLPGRENLIRKLPIVQDGIWADLGCGTGYNLVLMGKERAKNWRKILLVDLSESLLSQAEKRVQDFHLDNVELMHEDVCQLKLEKSLDLITFSYSLTMIPQWYKALEKAYSLLKPGGIIGVVDFYVAQKHPTPGMQPHSLWTRNFWPLWFSWDNVRLNPDHLPYLMDKFQKMEVFEAQNKVPYAPFGNVPYYVFVGKKEAVF